MPRPRLKRKISNPPIMEGFKPFGMPLKNIESITLLFEEYESIKLSDYEGLTQEQAAEKMNISRPTYTRIYEKARRSIAKAFVEGKAVFIEGGNFHSDDFWYKCDKCLKMNTSPIVANSCNICKSKIIRKLNNNC